MEYEVKEKQLEHPTLLAPCGTPNNLYPQLLLNNNCQMYEVYKEFVSNNNDLTRVILNEVDKPMKYVDF